MENLSECCACSRNLGELEGYLEAYTFENAQEDIACKGDKQLEIFQVVKLPLPCKHKMHSMCFVDHWKKSVDGRPYKSGKQIFMFHCPIEKCEGFYCFFSELELIDCRSFVADAWRMEQNEDPTGRTEEEKQEHDWSLEMNIGDPISEEDFASLLADLEFPDSDPMGNHPSPSNSDIGCVAWDEYFAENKEQVMKGDDQRTLTELTSVPSSDIDQYLYGYVVDPLPGSMKMTGPPPLNLDDLFSDARSSVSEETVGTSKNDYSWLSEGKNDDGGISGAIQPQAAAELHAKAREILPPGLEFDGPIGWISQLLIPETEETKTFFEQNAKFYECLTP